MDHSAAQQPLWSILPHNAVFCCLTSIIYGNPLDSDFLFQSVLAEQGMELVKKSADLEKKKRFGEILRKLDCVLVSEMLIAVEESLLVVLSMEYHWTLQIGGTLTFYPLYCKEQ